MSAAAGVLGVRAFIPARDFAASQRFYAALGFTLGHVDAQVAVLTLGESGVIVQNWYDRAYAENCMVQLMVEDVDDWWARCVPPTLAADCGVQQPKPPAVQGWGLKVGFIWDPSGVLWHITERPA